MPERPNGLWIMADQLRFDDLSCYGHPHLQTPVSMRTQCAVCGSPMPMCNPQFAAPDGCRPIRGAMCSATGPGETACPCVWANQPWATICAKLTCARPWSAKHKWSPTYPAWRGLASTRKHHHRVLFRSRRLHGRSLDGRQEFLPRSGGQSPLDLTPILHGKDVFSRQYAISEHDYYTLKMHETLGIPQEDAHTIMIFDGRWKYIPCVGFRPILFDLQTDPQELTDLGRSNDDTVTALHTRITATPDIVARMDNATEMGILIGYWDEAEFEADTGIAFQDLKPVGKPDG